MASTPEHISMALFCDFENVALGVRDANYDKFDIKRVLERLLLKGSIVVKKAYCDWDRYRNFKSAMHEANFELIEIPHVRQSGKNSADIRLVVDALDLCYTKSHVNTFVIISGDSDFSPLVSKLRENAKYVIGVGVKQSTSDLLTANCDEFIFYDDLVRESARVDARRNTRNNQPAAKRTPEEEQSRRVELDARRSKAVEMAVETYEALVTDRDEGGKIWASVLKEAIKRRNPGFNENYYGFRTFGNLLEEAKSRGLLEFGRDEKSSAFVFRGTGVSTVTETANADALRDEPSDADMTQGTFTAEVEREEPTLADVSATEVPRESTRPASREGEPRGRRRTRGRDRDRDRGERNENLAQPAQEAMTPAPQNSQVPNAAPAAEVSAVASEVAPQKAGEATEKVGQARRRSATTGRNKASAGTRAKPVAETASPAETKPAAPAQADAPAQVTASPSAATNDTGAAPAAKKARRAPAKKATTRAPRKTSTPKDAA